MLVNAYGKERSWNNHLLVSVCFCVEAAVAGPSLLGNDTLSMGHRVGAYRELTRVVLLDETLR